MSCILRFANLPDGEITAAGLNSVLDEAGLTDRTDARLVDEGGERVVYFYLPWQRHIADGVAKRLDGRMWRRNALRIAAAHLFGRRRDDVRPVPWPRARASRRGAASPRAAHDR